MVHLNDDPPESPKFTQMGADLYAMQAADVKVSAFVGGAAQGSFPAARHGFRHLLSAVEKPGHDKRAGTDGLDLDVEENMSQAGFNRLVDQLTTDFGTGSGDV